MSEEDDCFCPTARSVSMESMGAGYISKKEISCENVRKAVQIRIKQRYNCEEQRITSMKAPFRGFAVFVRFHCRARIHHVRTVRLPEVLSPQNKEADESNG
ncbi:unnamed protein product [Caenorhabditis auriculariae]|uniref:Uncharacterized protein n=1 Tax=Caenorhabditis auriculariae TaxID=2777116 RepID=A0A8S1GU49_9PELO|nr:unnamed protein product [Caenorhabditis auriculariae]